MFFVVFMVFMLYLRLNHCDYRHPNCKNCFLRLHFQLVHFPPRMVHPIFLRYFLADFCVTIIMLKDEFFNAFWNHFNAFNRGVYIDFAPVLVNFPTVMDQLIFSIYLNFIFSWNGDVMFFVEFIRDPGD